jgi:hypothetical protein
VISSTRAHDDGDGARRVEVFARRLLLVEVALRDEEDHPVLAESLVHGADRLLARDEERHDHERVNDDVPQRQHRKLFGNLQLRLAGVHRLD